MSANTWHKRHAHLAYNTLLETADMVTGLGLKKEAVALIESNGKLLRTSELAYSHRQV